MSKKSTGRDREATRRSLIEAVGQILAQQGFQGIGVNAVAKQADVDKVLIYRYFDGLPGLIRAYGQEGDFWPSNHELCGGDIVAFYHLPPVERAVQVMRNYIQAIRNRPVTQEILAWEMVERNELTAELETVREQRAMELMPLLADPHQGEPDPFAPMISAIVGATVNYLACRSRHIRYFNGLDLKDDAGWEMLANTFEHLIQINANYR